MYLRLPQNFPSGRPKAARHTSGIIGRWEPPEQSFLPGKDLKRSKSRWFTSSRGQWRGNAGSNTAEPDPPFYRPEAERQRQKSTTRLELLVELVLSLPHYYRLDFEGEQASAANWKMESSNDSFCGFLLILNVKQIIIDHSQLGGFLPSAHTNDSCS